MKINLENKNELVAIDTLYFRFEEDFMEENVRCIPMVVRFKLDAAGIKLKLAEWSRLNVKERKQLTLQPCNNEREILAYRNYLFQLVTMRTGSEPADLPVDPSPAWANMYHVEEFLQAKASEYNWHISVPQWIALSDLQRFALLKLYRPGHENKNFPKAMKEFNLV